MSAATAPEIYVDGDACPVKAEVVRVAERLGLVVHLVSNRALSRERSPWVRRVMVGDGMDAADDWIAERIDADDLAVTADVRLAARCVAKRARVVAPDGRPFSEDGIGMAVAMRDLMADLRDRDAVRTRNAPFTPRDRSRFLSALDAAARAAIRARGAATGAAG